MMGARCTVSCRSCGFQKLFLVGVGMGYHSLEAVIDRLHYMRRSRVLTLLKEHTVHETKYEHRIYRCDRCGQLRNSFWTKIIYDDDLIYETHFQCGKCQKRMVNISARHQIDGESCPCCGQKKLQVLENHSLD